MKKTGVCRDCRGTSLIELVVALFISSIVIAGLFRVARSVFESANREKQKAEMIRAITTVSTIIERDIRLAGIGLPGNGMRAILFTEQSDYLALFSNENGTQTALTTDLSFSSAELYVNDASTFKEDEWVCIQGADTIYREIAVITLYSSSSDKITLTDNINGPYTYVAGSNVFPATRILYAVSKNSQGPALVRQKNDMKIALGAELEKISVIPKNASGTVVSSARDADVLTVVLGGYIGSDGNKYFLADSTEVNIRN